MVLYDEVCKGKDPVVMRDIIENPNLTISALCSFVEGFHMSHSRKTPSIPLNQPYNTPRYTPLYNPS